VAIQSQTRFMDSLWNWDIFAGCFTNPHVKVSDIDGMVELNGYFLYLETKGIGVKMPRGQEIAFEKRVEDGRSTVIYIFGDRDRPEMYQIVGVMTRPEPCDLAGLRAVLTEWETAVLERTAPRRNRPCWSPRPRSRCGHTARKRPLDSPGRAWR